MKIWDVTIDDEIREGDEFDLELGDFLIETTVSEILDDGVVIYADAPTLKYIMEFVKSPLNESEDMEEAKYQGHEVSLGKPFLTPDGPKKRSVYVKNPKGNIVKINFGDKKMRIKKSNPKRRKSFRARHNCENPGPRWKARYWSCRAW
ncbi:hypothetical protein EBS02_07500 [bacterium]|nr:hypothetical protein [bacterium]